jgi:hypothetical protein
MPAAPAPPAATINVSTGPLYVGVNVPLLVNVWIVYPPVVVILPPEAVWLSVRDCHPTVVYVSITLLSVL